MENKPGQEGSDPFTIKKQEKKFQKEKENMRKMKNDLHAVKTMHGKSSLKSVTNILADKQSKNNSGEEEVRKQ